jgi:hypothetical protein
MPSLKVLQDAEKRAGTAFFKIIIIIENIHDWAEKTPRRRKIVFRVSMFLLAIFVQIMYWGIQEWGERGWRLKEIAPIHWVQTIMKWAGG